MNYGKLEKNLKVIELDDGFQIVDSKKVDEEEFIMRYATMCRRCNRNALLKYEYKFTCYVCEFNVVKTKHLCSSKNNRYLYGN